MGTSSAKYTPACLTEPEFPSWGSGWRIVHFSCPGQNKLPTRADPALGPAGTLQSGVVNSTCKDGKTVLSSDAASTIMLQAKRNPGPSRA